MKKMTSKFSRTQSKASEVLQSLYELTDFMASSYYYPGKSYADILRIRRGSERKEYYQTIQYLRRKKLIDVKFNAKKVSVALTPSGQLRALRENIRGDQKLLPVGESCIVIFDIPESKRSIRQAFRYFLKECGFKMVQGSVWESSYDVASLVAEFVHRAGLQKWVDVVSAKRRMHNLRKTPAGRKRDK